MTDLDAHMDALMKSCGYRYALVRGAGSTDELNEWLPLGYSVVAPLRHKSGSPAWLISGLDYEPGVFASIVAAGATVGTRVEERTWSSPIVRAALAKTERTEPDDEDEDEEGEES